MTLHDTKAEMETVQFRRLQDSWYKIDSNLTGKIHKFLPEKNKLQREKTQVLKGENTRFTGNPKIYGGKYKIWREKHKF